METPREEIEQKSSRMLAYEIATSKRIFSLQQQLLFVLIPTIVIPLFLAAIFGYRSLKNNATSNIKSQLSNSTLLVKEALISPIEDLEKTPLLIANNLIVQQQIKKSNQLVTTEKLNALSIKELEQKFNRNKLIRVDLDLNNYLKSAVINSPFTEILITDKFGINVGYSNLPDDLVQRDETWWIDARTNSQFLSKPEFNSSSNVFSLSSVHTIRDLKSSEFLGVIKATLPISFLDRKIKTSLRQSNINQSQIVQIIDADRLSAIFSIALDREINDKEILGGQEIARLSQAIQTITRRSDLTSIEVANLLPEDIAIKNIKVAKSSNLTGEKSFTFSFTYDNRQYSLTPIPNTFFVVVASIDKAEINIVANNLIIAFLGITTILIAIVSFTVMLLARKIATPLQNLAVKAEEVAAGNLEVFAELEGSTETVTLANSFNNLLQKITESLEQQRIALQNAEIISQEAEQNAREQEAKNIRVQRELLTLLEDVEGASQGDLTVRSQINDGEIGIVADFFNSIIESLREIVARVKTGTEKVNTSVSANKTTMNQLAQEASQQAEQITETLLSVENITQSIQQVALNAQEAAQVARIASSKAKQGGEGMELTVNSIQQLRGTIGETAAKVKVLGEASQQISRVISLINQIAMQTNLLAINASIEAARAGEEGKGFAVVAEEVGELATQSSEATKEVGTIIAGIQKEIFQVVEAMEIGLAQAEKGTNLVEDTKESLEQIVTVSYQIDNLVQTISKTTVSQAETSQTVTQLMEQIAEVSNKTSRFSQSASSSLESTVEIAQELRSSVGTFKIDRED